MGYISMHGAGLEGTWKIFFEVRATVSSPLFEVPDLFFRLQFVWDGVASYVLGCL